MSIAALFTMANTWEQPECPLKEKWIKMWYIYTTKYYSAMKKNENFPFATIKMDLDFSK